MVVADTGIEFVVVTGLSGSGKSVAVNALEDMGFYCVDNMPPQLIKSVADICNQSGSKAISKVAMVTDIRGGELFTLLPQVLGELKSQGMKLKILFLDAANEVIMRRYKETRRKHPLDDHNYGNLSKAVEEERRILESVREQADYYVDTSLLSTSQLKEQIASIFLEDLRDLMPVQIMSFGFKYGVPNEADLMFDVRCLPNPFYVPELRPFTGQDAPVSDFVMANDSSKQLLAKLIDLVDFLIPLYMHEGKSRLVIAFGCTGGKHRSVTFAEELYAHLSAKGVRTMANHRDITKDK